MEFSASSSAALGDNELDTGASDAVVATRRRAELRGLKAEARSKINVGVWTMRLYATNFALLHIIALVSGELRTASTFGVLMSLFIISSLRFERGSRTEAIGLGILFVSSFALTALAGTLSLIELAVGAAAALGIIHGIRGVFALHRIREQQQALLFDPVEERPSLT